MLAGQKLLIPNFGHTTVCVSSSLKLSKLELILKPVLLAHLWGFMRYYELLEKAHRLDFLADMGLGNDVGGDQEDMDDEDHENEGGRRNRENSPGFNIYEDEEMEDVTSEENEDGSDKDAEGMEEEDDHEEASDISEEIGNPLKSPLLLIVETSIQDIRAEEEFDKYV